MSERALYLISLYTFEIGWIVYALIFLLSSKGSLEKAKRADPASIGGIIFQTLSYVMVWSLPRRHETPLFPLGLWFQFLSTILVVVIIILSLWMMSAAVRVLGKQWSLQARVLEDHKLVREGPYRFVRHPIYTGMLGMLIATGLVYSHWVAFVAALALYGVGTAIRVRSEEKLLREQFGAAFDDYKRRVPAVVPVKF